jgi:hypothetical protein
MPEVVLPQWPSVLVKSFSPAQSDFSGLGVFGERGGLKGLSHKKIKLIRSDMTVLNGSLF